MKELQRAANGLAGTISLPGDKSMSHRAVMIGSLATGLTTIDQFAQGEDCQTTVNACRALGVQIDQEKTRLVVHGVGLRGLKKAPDPLQMNNSGTTTRLLMGILAGQNFTSCLLGDRSLSQRPMKRVSDPLTLFGGEVQLSAAGTLPAVIRGHFLHGANYQLPVASAQLKSALLFAALLADRPSRIIEKLPTRNHTEIMLRQFGADVKTNGDREIIVHPAKALVARTLRVPGDISSAAFWLTAGTLVPHSQIRLSKVGLNPYRTGILKVLTRMGANLAITQRPADGEPIGDVVVRSGHLRPITLGPADIPAVIDELPLVALLAASVPGQSSIRGAGELRFKETDRIKATIAILRQLGVTVTELHDGMVITGKPDWQVMDPVFDSFGDHRLGMMVAVAALKAKQPLFLANSAAIDVSYPRFFADLARLMR